MQNDVWALNYLFARQKYFDLILSSEQRAA